MWTRRALLAVVFGALLAGCGQQQTQRSLVASYLKKIDQIEKQLAAPLAKVTATGAQFTREERSGGSLTGLLPAAHEQTLLRAWAKIEQERDRLAGLKAPRPAIHLRSLLLQIADGQAKLTRELAQLVVFLPRYNSALRPLAPAARRLDTVLARRSASGSGSPAAVASGEAAALHQFSTSVNGIVRRVAQLRPPSVSKPDFQAQLTALRGMSSAAGRLAGVLQGGAQGNLQQLLAQFDRAATSTQTIAAQKARIAAVKAYDGESTRLNQLTQAAQAERLRLANNLT